MSLRSSIAPKLVATVSAAALLTMAPGWSSSSWASARLANTAHTTHHSSVSGTWKGSYSGSFLRHVQADLDGDEIEPERHDHDLGVR